MSNQGGDDHFAMKRVICTYCNTHIYTYVGPDHPVSFKAEYFIPTSPAYPKPKKDDRIKCPDCGIEFVAFSNQLSTIQLLSDWPFEGTGMEEWKK
jgi:DNA-directed RNA polymerase subunit RPC12/RpoP